MAITLSSAGGTEDVETDTPVLFFDAFDPLDGEWSVMLPNGLVLSDTAAVGWTDRLVRRLGRVAYDLNAEKEGCPLPTLGPIRYNRESIERALTHHVGDSWRRTAGGYRVAIGLGMVELRSLREAAVFVAGAREKESRIQRQEAHA